MPQVQRRSDKNDSDGIIDLIPQSTVFANNLEVAVDGSQGTFHFPWSYPHFGSTTKPYVWKTTAGSPTVFANNIPVNLSLIHISEHTRRPPISNAVFC